MNYKLISSVLGRLIFFFSCALIAPIILAIFDGEYIALVAFSATLLVSFYIAGMLIVIGRGQYETVPVAAGAIILWLFFSYLTVLGILPYILSGRYGFVDAFIESVSGFTTTGFSILPETDIARSFIIWRSLTQWLGGLAFVGALLTVLLPLGAGFGLVLPNSIRLPEARLLTSMRRLLKRVSLVYCFMSAIICLLFLLVGLNFFDALNLALVTVSTGGAYRISNPDDFSRPPLILALIVGMFLSSGNFILYYEVVKKRSLKFFYDYGEFRFFFYLVGASGFLAGLYLFLSGTYSFGTSFLRGMLEAVSFATTTGLITGEFVLWPPFVRFILLLLVFSGGCIGSASGGLKMARISVLLKTAYFELTRTLFPHRYIAIKLGKTSVDEKVISRILNFFFLFCFILLIGVFFITLFSDMDILDAYLLSVSCLSGVGQAARLFGIPDLFQSLSILVKLCCAFLMMIGRLEITAVFLLFGAIYSLLGDKGGKGR